MKNTTVTIGKYKGQPFSAVPYSYADWMRINGNKKFYAEWVENLRFCKHTHFERCTSPDGRWLERTLDEGYIFYITAGTINRQNRTYYIVDKDGNYVRDLMSFGTALAKQGAIDTTQTDWVTLTPSGQVITGKMLVSPYYEHFAYETYQTTTANV